MGREFGVQGSATMIVWPMVPCCLWSNVDIQLQTGLSDHTQVDNIVALWLKEWQALFKGSVTFTSHVADVCL